MSYIVHIVAMSKDGYIGVGDKLPFSVPEDLQNFKALTDGSLICMGFNTFESIYNNYHKKGKDFLPGRKVTVVCSTAEKAVKRSAEFPVDNVLFVEQRMFNGLVHRNRNSIIIVGGAQLYRQFRPNLIIATAVDTEVVPETDSILIDEKDSNIRRRKSDNELLVSYPYFDRLQTDWNSLSFQTVKSTSGLEYTYKVYHPTN